MNLYTQNLPTILFVSLGMGFFSLCLFLEWLKTKNSKEINTTQKRFFYAYGGGGLLFFLYGFGENISFLKTSPLAYVLYWWSTFNIGLLLFLIPFLFYRENFTPKGNMIHKNSEKPIISAFIKKSSPDMNSLTKPPTVH